MTRAKSTLPESVVHDEQRWTGARRPDRDHQIVVTGVGRDGRSQSSRRRGLHQQGQGEVGAELHLDLGEEPGGAGASHHPGRRNRRPRPPRPRGCPPRWRGSPSRSRRRPPASAAPHRARSGVEGSSPVAQGEPVHLAVGQRRQPGRQVDAVGDGRGGKLGGQRGPYGRRIDGRSRLGHQVGHDPAVAPAVGLGHGGGAGVPGNSPGQPRPLRA